MGHNTGVKLFCADTWNQPPKVFSEKVVEDWETFKLGSAENDSSFNNWQQQPPPLSNKSAADLQVQVPLSSKQPDQHASPSQAVLPTSPLPQQQEVSQHKSKLGGKDGPWLRTETQSTRSLSSRTSTKRGASCPGLP